MATVPSEAGIVMIEGFEIDNPYNPLITWPGGASGPTGGIGYDFAYESASQIEADWGDLLDASTITKLQSYVGCYGSQAQKLVQSAHGIVIPRSAAEKVFRERNIPRYTTLTLSTYNCTMLNGDGLGSMVSLTFNRGTSMTDPPGRPNVRLEMRQIRDALAAGHPELVPGYFRSMKRLWVGLGLNGLISRREAEAVMFEKSLGSGVNQPPKHTDAPVQTADDLMEAELKNLNQ